MSVFIIGSSLWNNSSMSWLNAFEELEVANLFTFWESPDDFVYNFCKDEIESRLKGEIYNHIICLYVYIYE